MEKKAGKPFLNFSGYYLNPTILFVLSFLGLIAAGTILLILPVSATGAQISPIDALFMSASAVCVTGLAAFDISKALSPFGLNVILVLIQLGGIGIMTFTTFFAFLISGQSSFKDQIMHSQLLDDKNVSSIIRSLMNIVVLTLLFELLGMIFIFFAVSPGQFDSLNDRLYFSMFHSISAFCNAGFSTLSMGLYDESLRFNYALQLIIALLFILGGLGFTIIVNVQLFLKRWVCLLYYKILYSRPIIYRAWVMTFNSRLIALSTGILLLFGFITMFILEFNNSLAEHPTIFGKAVTAFFAGAVPRTAGFNTIDMTTISLPATVIMMVLMWIGASPGSTGGGIRTTTFAVSILNFITIAKNYRKIHIFHREIPPDSIRKAFAIIALSLIWIATAIFFLTISDGDKELTALTFETISAYGTVGLSLGITPNLSSAGKIIITCTMFVGRVGTVTLLVALIKSLNSRKYEYPEEQVLF